jgi:hypothetical protein
VELASTCRSLRADARRRAGGVRKKAGDGSSYGKDDAVGITAHAMQSMAIKGFIVHDRESGAYALTDSGRAALLAILGDAGLT